MPIHTEPKAPGAPTWVDLSAHDAPAAREFYKHVFGWQYDVGGPEFGFYATAHLDRQTTAGIGGKFPDDPSPAAWTLYFATHDIAADIARAEQLGANVIVPSMQIGTFGHMVVMLDTVGAPFAFWQAGEHMGAGVTDAPGATTWHELYSPDAKKSRDFYTALLGASVMPVPGGMEYYMLAHGDHRLCGIMQIEPAWGPMPAHWVTYFQVTDIKAAAAVAVALGGKQMGGIDDSPFGKLAALSDPQGAIFKLLQPNQ